MLNIDLVDNLYASLSKEQQQNLCSLLFKNSKQTMNYFRRTKDISLSKLETLADFFHMPLDYFRLGNSFATNNVNGNNNYIGNVSLSNNLLIENDSLRKEVESLKETLKAKDEALKAKDDLIQAKTLDTSKDRLYRGSEGLVALKIMSKHPTYFTSAFAATKD